MFESYKRAIGALAAKAGFSAASAEQAATIPQERSRGDLSLPCFALAKETRQPPQAVAQAIAAAFETDESFEAIEAAGPFLNFRIARTPFVRRLLAEVDESFGRSDAGQGRTVVVDYGSPNMAKPLLFHHLRSAVIGQALCNLHRMRGYEVVGINYLGDAGTPFGKLMVGLEGRESTDDANVLNEAYVRGSKACADDPAAMERARQWARRLEEQDPESVRLWEQMRAVSLHGFERIYSLLGVHHDVVDSEQMYFRPAAELVERLLQEGQAHESEGAIVIDPGEQALGVLIIRKTDGATLYQTRDLAAAHDRWERYAFAKSLYVVDVAQEHYFRQLFASLQAIGREWAGRCRHVAFGQVLMGGRRAKTREGRGVYLEEVLQEGVRRARAIIDEKNPDLPDKEEVARAVGVGAVIFSDVGYPVRKNINFDWEEILSFDGRTGPYLQYVHASAASILRKGEGAGEGDAAHLAHDLEWDLARRLAEFPAAVEAACEQCEPSVLASFLYDLGREFRAYHTAGARDAALRVLVDDSDVRAARLALVEAVRRTFAIGLRLLGLDPVEEM